jgi:hypothetical protein
MDRYELGVAFAAAHLAELRRQADRRAWPAASPAAPHVGAGTGRQGRHGSSGDTARPLTARPLPAVPGEQPRRQPC